jgi:ABC-2 type transport system permease protein
VSRTVLPALTLWRREIVRFLRQRNRVTAALVQPALFWVLFGAGFQGSFRMAAPTGAGGQDFLEYFFPGTVVLILLFTAIFSTISIIEDRREGFLQSVLAAPVSRSGIVLGKVLGGATLALLEGLAFMALAGVAGVPLSLPAFAAAVGVLAVIAFALTSLGVVIAWPMDSTQGFHAIMMLVLMPMWLLSGAFFPLAGGSAWLRWIMHLNPLTYGVAAFRGALYGGDLSGHGAPSLYVSLSVTFLFAALTFAAALWLVGRRGRGDSR